MVCRKLTRPNHRNGFSLIELIVAVAAAMILILGMGIMLTHSQASYTRMYKRAHSDVVEDAYSARRVFDRIVRKSTTRRCDLISDSEVYVYYYKDTPASPDYLRVDPDRYARFYAASGMLLVDYGDVIGSFDDFTLSKSTTLRLARNVQPLENTPIFSVRGRTVRMMMMLKNETESILLASSGVRHNK